MQRQSSSGWSLDFGITTPKSETHSVLLSVLPTKQGKWLMTLAVDSLSKTAAVGLASSLLVQALMKLNALNFGSEETESSEAESTTSTKKSASSTLQDSPSSAASVPRSNVSP